MENKYTTKVSWNSNKKIFIAELVEIHSLSSTGKTKVDAITNLDNEIGILNKVLIEKGSSLDEYAKKYDIEGIENILRGSIKNLENLKGYESNFTGIPSGFIEFDKEVQGWQKNELIIIGGRTGMGKTAFSLSLILNAAINFKKSVALFTTESDNERIVQRLLSNRTEIISQKIRNADLSDNEWERLNSKASELSDAPIFIDDTPRLSFFELQAKCRRLKEQGSLDLIVIDHLQSIRTPDIKEHQTKDQEVGENCRLLKELAKELKVPVIATAQLSRAVDTRYGARKPNLTDISESGIIEQIADMVIFLYRPEYYQLTEFEDGMPTQGLAEIMLAKHRNGTVRDFRVRFQGEFAKFSDIDGIGVPNQGGDFSFSEDQGVQSIIMQSKMNPMEEDSDVPF